MTAIDSKDGDLGLGPSWLLQQLRRDSHCEDQLERMARFRQLVLYWNQRMNLTRIVEDRDGCQTLCRQPGVGPAIPV